MFTGFSQNTIDFLWGITLNNNRDWFMPHKEEYNQSLYYPLKELGLDVHEKMVESFRDRQLNLQVTRIYRDVRRPHKDGPYKTHLWFVMHRASDERWAARPSFYFEIFPGGYETGMGYYCARPSMMALFRQRALEHPEELEQLAQRLNNRPAFHLEGEAYKRPKGEVSPLLKPWFNRKNICICRYREFQEKDVAFTPGLVEEVLEDFRWLMPFYDYFDALPSVPPI